MIFAASATQILNFSPKYGLPGENMVQFDKNLPLIAIGRRDNGVQLSF